MPLNLRLKIGWNLTKKINLRTLAQLDSAWSFYLHGYRFESCTFGQISLRVIGVIGSMWDSKSFGRGSSPRWPAKIK